MVIHAYSYIGYETMFRKNITLLRVNYGDHDATLDSYITHTNPHKKNHHISFIPQKSAKLLVYALFDN
jgi:hypothetical protein